MLQIISIQSLLDTLPGLSNMPTLAGLTWYELIGLGLLGVIIAKLLHAAVKTAVYVGLIVIVIFTVTNLIV